MDASRARIGTDNTRAMHNHGDLNGHILGMERAALDRWGRGDPDGYLEISAPDVVYFDPFVTRPIVGLAKLREYYEKIRGTIRIDKDELREARVQHAGSIAVLTFQYRSEGSERSLAWNCTEVYRQGPEGFRIIQTHWSFAAKE
jgi:ketosteroid isomerase-like protein